MVATGFIDINTGKIGDQTGEKWETFETNFKNTNNNPTSSGHNLPHKPGLRTAHLQVTDSAL